MTELNFTLNSRGWYEATLTGFTGYMQIDMADVGTIVVHGAMEGMEEAIISVYPDHKNMLRNFNIPSSVTMRIECDKPVTKAVYEEE